MDSENTPERYVIDTFAWIGYFAGSAEGAKARRYVESGRGITPTIVIAELSHKYHKERIPLDERLDFILGTTRIVPLDTATAVEAGRLSIERKRRLKRWGLADSIMLATARANTAKIVTGDEHFRDLVQETLMIK
jgi:predicted nucleic acid-binding protein